MVHEDVWVFDVSGEATVERIQRDGHMMLRNNLE